VRKKIVIGVGEESKELVLLLLKKKAMRESDCGEGTHRQIPRYL
jgi:hypothetical protein